MSSSSTNHQKASCKHLHCFDLSLPTNIYSMCVLHDKDFDYNQEEVNFVFVATSNCLFCIQQTTTVSAATLLPELFLNSSLTPSSPNSPDTPSLSDTSVSAGRKIQWDASPNSNISNLQIHEIPIHNTRIPADTDIISISAFRKKRTMKKSSSSINLSSASNMNTSISKSKSLTNINMESTVFNDDLIVVAVTFAQFLGEDVPPQCFLYLYKFTERELLLYSNPANSPTISPLISNIGSSFEDSNFIRSFSLNFVPLQLMRRNISYEGTNETVFFLSGTDKKVHCFLPDNRYNWVKADLPKFKMDVMPSLMNLQGNALCYDIYDSDTIQVTAIGCQNGFVQLYIKLHANNQCIDTPPLFLNGPVNTVKIFRCRSERPQNKPEHPLINKIKTLIDGRLTPEEDDSLSCLNLLVAESIGRVTLFRNIEKSIFSDPVVILHENPRGAYDPDLMSFDSVLCGHVADIDGDGINEILIGTYSKRVLVYKLTREENTITYERAEQFKFPAPIFSIKTLDINRDGLDELFVCSMYHVHVMQPDLDRSKQLVTDRLRSILSVFEASKQTTQDSTATELAM